MAGRVLLLVLLLVQPTWAAVFCAVEGTASATATDTQLVVPAGFADANSMDIVFIVSEPIGTAGGPGFFVNDDSGFGASPYPLRLDTDNDSGVRVSAFAATTSGYGDGLCTSGHCNTANIKVGNVCTTDADCAANVRINHGWTGAFAAVVVNCTGVAHVELADRFSLCQSGLTCASSCGGLACTGNSLLPGSVPDELVLCATAVGVGGTITPSDPGPLGDTICSTVGATTRCIRVSQRVEVGQTTNGGSATVAGTPWSMLCLRFVPS